MVAFRSSRREPSTTELARLGDAESLVDLGGGLLRTAFQAGGSRRLATGIRIVHDNLGAIAAVHIGRWRIVKSSAERQIAEVRPPQGGRVAVRLRPLADGSGRPPSVIWQLYDLSGRLDAALQTSSDGRFAVLSNYQTRQACRLIRNRRDELEAVETWNI